MRTEIVWNDEMDREWQCARHHAIRSGEMDDWWRARNKPRESIDGISTYGELTEYRVDRTVDHPYYYDRLPDDIGGIRDHDYKRLEGVGLYEDFDAQRWYRFNPEDLGPRARAYEMGADVPIKDVVAETSNILDEMYRRCLEELEEGTELFTREQIRHYMRVIISDSNGRRVKQRTDSCGNVTRESTDEPRKVREYERVIVLVRNLRRVNPSRSSVWETVDLDSRSQVIDDVSQELFDDLVPPEEMYEAMEELIRSEIMRADRIKYLRSMGIL